MKSAWMRTQCELVNGVLVETEWALAIFEHSAILWDRLHSVRASGVLTFLRAVLTTLVSETRVRVQVW